MNQQSVIQALTSASDLLLLLSQAEEPSDSQLSTAFAQIFWTCEPLIEERACLIPLALLRERIRKYLLERGMEGSPPRLYPHRSQHHATLHLILKDTERLQAALSEVLERRRHSPLRRSVTGPHQIELE